MLQSYINAGREAKTRKGCRALLLFSIDVCSVGHAVYSWKVKIVHVNLRCRASLVVICLQRSSLESVIQIGLLCTMLCRRFKVQLTPFLEPFSS